MRLGINTGFAVNRYPMPRQWLKVIGEDLNLRYAQLTADLINPDLGTKVISNLIKEINHYKKVYDVKIDSIMTGSFTRVNHFSHPDEQIRAHWKSWFNNLIDIAVEVEATNLSSHLGILCYEDLHNPARREFIMEETVKSWKELARSAAWSGLKYLTWEPMSIAREYGETIDETKKIINLLKGSEIPIQLCLDVDHGDITSKNKDDVNYKKLLENFAGVSPLIHIKQSLKEKGGHYPFTKEYNQKGKIKPKEFVDTLKKFNGLENVLVLFELSFREREPIDSNVISILKESVDYWRRWIV